MAKLIQLANKKCECTELSRCTYCTGIEGRGLSVTPDGVKIGTLEEIAEDIAKALKEETETFSVTYSIGPVEPTNFTGKIILDK